jgi:hypothetical protein
MEHGLILLIEAILAIDRNLQKPVRAVIPNLSRLRSDPKVVLGDEEIVIGPRKARAVATVLGAITATVVLLGFTFGALDRPRNQPVGGGYFVAAGISIIASGAAVTALALRWLRGGSAVVRAEGVVFVYRGRSVFCPWTLFQAAGSPYQPDHKRVILPANDGIPVALTTADGDVAARPAAEVKSRPLSGASDGQVVLSDLYEVKLVEFGELLLHLGRQLGDGRVVLVNGDAKESAVAPVAIAQPGGWLRIRMTRLPFPHVCAGCGVGTRESIQHTLDVKNTVQIHVPLCRACKADRTGRRRRAVIIGAAAGLLPLLLGLLIASAFLNGLDLLLLSVLLFVVGLILGLVGGIIARDRAGPAWFKEYDARAGTVAMRLRPSGGAVTFRRALGVGDEADDPTRAEASATAG